MQTVGATLDSNRVKGNGVGRVHESAQALLLIPGASRTVMDEVCAETVGTTAIYQQLISKDRSHARKRLVARHNEFSMGVFFASLCESPKLPVRYVPLLKICLVQRFGFSHPRGRIC